MARKTIEKTCTKTGQKFSGTFDELTEFFYRDKSQKDGLSPWSKAAERAYNKAYSTGLKKANAPRKRDIGDDKSLGAFERAMKAERVTRSRKATDGTRTPQSKARTTSRRRARSTKKAQA